MWCFPSLQRVVCSCSYFADEETRAQKYKEPCLSWHHAHQNHHRVTHLVKEKAMNWTHSFKNETWDFVVYHLYFIIKKFPICLWPKLHNFAHWALIHGAPHLLHLQGLHLLLCPNSCSSLKPLMKCHLLHEAFSDSHKQSFIFPSVFSLHSIHSSNLAVTMLYWHYYFFLNFWILFIFYTASSY